MDKSTVVCDMKDCVNHEVRGKYCNKGRVNITEDGCKDYEPFSKMMQGRSASCHKEGGRYKSKHLSLIK